MCFQVPFGFLSRRKTRPYRVLCVLKNASKSRDISREKNARVTHAFCLWSPLVPAISTGSIHGLSATISPEAMCDRMDKNTI